MSLHFELRLQRYGSHIDFECPIDPRNQAEQRDRLERE